MRINQWCENNKDLLKMHTHFRLNESFTKEGSSSQNLYLTLLRIIELGQKRGELRKDISAESLAKYLSTYYTASFLEWFAGESTQLGEKAMAELLDLFLFGASG